MNIVDIIIKKKNKKELTYEEIKFAIDGYINKSIKNYQISSLLMAITINGMTLEETINLTRVMIESGEVFDLSSLGHTIDKHSTGGVGDKTTLVLAPLVAACGSKVVKMSGRGLGYTGGTIDKLESIEGFKTSLTKEEFIKQVEDIGVAITSQTGEIAKADKLLYSLRDVTGTTESIPLIASSIMSKKIASGADAFVIDLKVGNGALMKTEEDARLLASTMIQIAKYYNRKVVCVLTNMNQPLGNAIGNGLEVLESINTLKGNGPKDFEDLIIKLAAIMLGVDQKLKLNEAIDLIKENISNGNAYNKFEELIKYQGGNIENIETSDRMVSIKSSKTGFIKNINTMRLGEIVRNMGAGRIKKGDKIDYGVGLVLSKKQGDYVTENEEIVKAYISNKDVNVSEILNCFEIDNVGPNNLRLIIDIIE